MSNQQTEKDNSSNANTDLGEFMKVMDIADIVRRSDKGVRQQLSIDEEKAQLKKKLRETYDQMGTSVEDSQLNRAVEDYYSQKWEFKAPKKGIATNLAGVYVDRARITRKRILPAMAILTAGFLAVKTIIGGVNVYHVGLERQVEAAIETSFQETGDIKNSSALVLNSAFIKQLPAEEAENLRNELDSSKAKLNETNPFFERYCPKGISDDAVTQQNYLAAKGELDNLSGKITSAKTSLENAKAYIVRQEQFNETEKSLENLLGKVKATNPAKPLLTKAEIFYEQGRQGIINRKLEDAKTAVNGLSQVSVDCRDFNSLIEQAYQLYNSAEKIVVEENAKDKIKKIKGTIDSYAQLADVASLRNSTQELRDINETLNEEYTIETVNQEGIRTGLWRESKDTPARNDDDRDPQGKRFYLVVHAINSKGQEISVKKRNIEDGTISQVVLWGEGVPNEVYLRVKEDKIDNGLVDNSTSRDFENRYIGQKKRGYLEVTPIMKDNSGKYFGNLGQLTKEENNWERTQ